MWHTHDAMGWWMVFGFLSWLAPEQSHHATASEGAR
jgi:hypothetical protein